MDEEITLVTNLKNLGMNKRGNNDHINEIRARLAETNRTHS